MEIDLVYTWVDGSDADHCRLREFYGGKEDARRWRSHDELRYSLRSIERYAPWFRKIHLVTNGQRPGWLADNPWIRIVNHEEIYPDPSVLPTFNSVSIESFLHRIPGLSERFVYSNDDAMLLGPVAPEDFFSPSGRMKVFYALGAKQLAVRTVIPEQDNTYTAGVLNATALLESAFPRSRFFTTAHQMNAYTKNLFLLAQERWPEAFHTNALNRFRSYTDVAFNSALLPNFAVQIRLGLWQQQEHYCCSIGDLPRYAYAFANRPRFFCIHDNGRNTKGLEEFFEKLLPGPSCFER